MVTDFLPFSRRVAESLRGVGVAALGLLVRLVMR